jgi:hypothetical protein
MTAISPSIEMPMRPDLPPGVSVKFIEPNDTAYPKWARGKWSTSYGEGHGIDGYDTREEATDCTWTAWRSHPRFSVSPGGAALSKARQVKASPSDVRQGTDGEAHGHQVPQLFRTALSMAWQRVAQRGAARRS